MKHSLWLFVLFSLGYIETALALPVDESCLLEKIKQADDAVTIGDLKAQCTKQADIAVEPPPDQQAASALAQR